MARGKEVKEIEDEESEGYEGMEEDELEEEDVEELERKEKKAEIPRKLKKTVKLHKRFAVFSYPPRTGIVDVETNEIIAEGELAVLQILALILERLERIETNLGSLMGR